MKKMIFTLFVVLQVNALFAYDRYEFDKIQRSQQSNIEEAYKNGKLTLNEYKKLMQQQDIIRESIELADLDHHWTLMEYNTVKLKLERSAKRLRRYQLNGERF